MSKPFMLIQAPVATRSGYGSHSRDLVRSLIKMDKFDIKVLSLQDKGQLYSDIKKLGVPVYCFSMFHKIDFIFKVSKFNNFNVHSWYT